VLCAYIKIVQSIQNFYIITSNLGHCDRLPHAMSLLQEIKQINKYNKYINFSLLADIYQITDTAAFKQ